MSKLKSFIYNLLPGVKVTTAHYVDDGVFEKDACVISVKKFLDYINLNKNNFISVKDGLKKLKSKKIIFSIDDGLKCLFTCVYKTFVSLNIPLIAFISADLLDKDGYITTNELIEMSKNPLVTIGSHGLKHKKLIEMTFEEIKDEIFNSKQKLENIIGKKIDYFAYPGGYATKREFKLCKQAGYKYAFGVTPRKLNAISKLFLKYNLPRYNLTNKTEF